MFVITRKEFEAIIDRCRAFNMEPFIDEFKFEEVLSDSGVVQYKLLAYLGEDTEVDIKDTFDIIGSNAFRDTRVTYVDTGEALFIHNMAFADSPYLKKVVANKVAMIGREAFKHCVRLECIELENVTTIESCAFGHCVSLESVIGLGKLQKIEDEAFKNCLKLKNINLENVSALDQKAFIYCTSLEEVRFSKLEYLSKRAFSHCINLRKVYGPKLLNFAPCVFDCCMNLQELWLEDTVWFMCYLGTNYSIGVPDVIHICGNVSKKSLTVFEDTKLKDTKIVLEGDLIDE